MLFFLFHERLSSLIFHAQPFSMLFMMPFSLFLPLTLSHIAAMPLSCFDFHAFIFMLYFFSRTLIFRHAFLSFLRLL